MVAELPLGGSTKLMDTIRLLKWPVSISPLSSAIWGHWQFPSAFWDVEKQQWRSQKDELKSWLGILREDCENLVVDELDSDSEFYTIPKSRK
jgi:hypothetical protein